jgi:uncharacterized protein YjbI with pentapeptide repeats
MRSASCLIAMLVFVGCDKPTGTLDRYLAAQPVASKRDMAELMALLRKGDVGTFNRVRTNAPFAGKRLDFRSQSLAGFTLPGADLSNSVFSGADFTGADLSRSSFRGSYLATAHADALVPWMHPSRRTSLANCDFSGAILVATEYVITSEFGEPVDVRTQKEFRFGLGGADVSGAVGLQPLFVK